MTYCPRPGTIPDRCVKYLQSLPPGSEVSTTVLAETVDFPKQSAVDYLWACLRSGLLTRRRPRAGSSPWFWRLGDGTPISDEDLKKQAIVATRRGDAQRRIDMLESAARKSKTLRLDHSLPVVNNGVKVQKLKGFTEDIRFKVDPKAHGAGFMDEWRRLTA